MIAGGMIGPKPYSSQYTIKYFIYYEEQVQSQDLGKSHTTAVQLASEWKVKS